MAHNGAEGIAATGGCRVLLLAPFPPRLDAPHGGGRAIAELITELTRGHRVALQYLRGPGEPAVDASIEMACDVVREVARPGERGIAHWTRLAGGLARGEPMWVAGWRVPAFTDALGALIADWRPDIVQLEYHIMGQYLPIVSRSRLPSVLHQLEPGAAASDDRARRRRGLGRLTSGIDRRAWARYERRVMGAADTVVALTERDARALRGLAPDACVTCIPLGMSIPHRSLNAAGDDTASLLFIGNFGHPPNVDAAMRLAHDIFPGIRRAHPAARLQIVGPDPGGRIRALAGNGVVVTGEVPNVQPYLDRAAAVIVPLRLGGGMRVKVMEALAAGKAVIASPLAVEGLTLQHDEQVMIAETDAAFIAAAAALLSDRARRAALGSRARAWALEHLGWRAPARAFTSLYESLLGR